MKMQIDDVGGFRARLLQHRFQRLDAGEMPARILAVQRQHVGTGAGAYHQNAGIVGQQGGQQRGAALVQQLVAG